MCNMFSTFLIVVIYISISPCTTNDKISNVNGETNAESSSYEQEVKNELKHFDKLLREIEDPDTAKQAQINKNEGIILGKLGEILKRAIRAEHKIDRLKENEGVLKTLRNVSLHDLKILEVPLVFRNYVNKIEDKFPDVKAVIPVNVMRNQNLHKGILERKYNWMVILSEDKYSTDVHVTLIRTALKKEFFSEKNIILEKEITDLTTEEKEKYDQFLEVFCEGIAASVDYVNKIAHADFGRYPGNDLLNMFEKAYDKYVSLFYHAVVGPAESKKNTVS